MDILIIKRYFSLPETLVNKRKEEIMSNVKKLAEIVLREHLDDIALDIIQAKRWLSSFDDLPIKTYIQITWSILSYDNEFDLDELEKSVHSLYREMMTAREPFEDIEWDYMTIEVLVNMLASFWSEDD
jgi:hypothetical protein